MLKQIWRYSKGRIIWSVIWAEILCLLSQFVGYQLSFWWFVPAFVVFDTLFNVLIDKPWRKIAG